MIAVLVVLFLRQAVELAGDLDLLKLSAALALMIAALVLFLLSSGAQMEGEYFSQASLNLTRAFSLDLGPEGKRSTYGDRWRTRRVEFAFAKSTRLM